jgi:hypothetical protein
VVPKRFEPRERSAVSALASRYAELEARALAV